MSVMFTQEAEMRRQKAIRERHAKKSIRQWELLSTSSLVEALQFAKEHGWENKKVQVKAYRINDEEFEYMVEPYEKDCKCPNLIDYDDYFDRESSKEDE